MAKYKTLPNYEIIRPKLHIQFDSEGHYETSEESIVKYLDDKAPFIERLDKPEPKKVEEKPKPKPTPRTTASKAK